MKILFFSDLHNFDNKKLNKPSKIKVNNKNHFKIHVQNTRFYAVLQ